MTPPLPPFSLETAQIKVKLAQDAWNTTDPGKVLPVYTEDSIWRNRDSFLRGHAEIRAFLEAKWAREKSYRLRKELFAFTDNRIAVQFWYEFQAVDDVHATTSDTSAGTGTGTGTSASPTGQWYRCYGLEDWTFAADGRMHKRMMSGNNVAIAESERWFRDGVDVNTLYIDEKHW